MTARTGRDGRPLVDTELAAYAVGIKTSSFRSWATRHGVKAVGFRPNFRGGQARALWDLVDISAAKTTPRRPTSTDLLDLQ